MCVDSYYSSVKVNKKLIYVTFLSICASDSSFLKSIMVVNTGSGEWAGPFGGTTGGEE